MEEKLDKLKKILETIQSKLSNIEENIYILALIMAAVIIYFIIKKFLYDGAFRSKKLSKYNEVLYLIKRNEKDKASFVIMDYLGFDIPEEEIDFVFSNPRNAFVFLTNRKKAGKNKVKFENGKYTVINNICDICNFCNFFSWLFFIIGAAMFSVYITFFSILLNSIEDKKTFILLSIYVLCISLPMMISSYVSISENQSAKQLEKFTSANYKGEKMEQEKKASLNQSSENVEDNNLREYFFKEIDLIQGIINRMARNSFMIKGWALTVAGIAYSLNLASSKSAFLCVGIPVICLFFWSLDAYYLRTERKYRALYNDVVDKYNHKKYDQINWFNLSTADYEYDPSVGSHKDVMLSKTLLPFYLCLIFVSILLLIASLFWGGAH